MEKEKGYDYIYLSEDFVNRALEKVKGDRGKKAYKDAQDLFDKGRHDFEKEGYLFISNSERDKEGNRIYWFRKKL